jgi:hypothetical protein
MRGLLLWIGILLAGAGLALIAAFAVMTYLGMSASYNLGDSAKFEFILVPFWLIGLVTVAVGAVCILLSRRLDS